MKPAVFASVRVLVAALLSTSAALGAASSNVYADPNRPGDTGDVQTTKLVTIAPAKLIPTPPVCGGRGDGGNRQEPRFDGPRSDDPPPPQQNYVFNFKKPEHYRYVVKGQTLVSGTAFAANGQTVTITAVPDSGYTFGKATASWDYVLTRVRCGG